MEWNRVNILVQGRRANPADVPPLATRFGPLADIAIDEDGRRYVVAANGAAARRIDPQTRVVETGDGTLAGA
jgi:hypothetical protein